MQNFEISYRILYFIELIRKKSKIVLDYLNYAIKKLIEATSVDRSNLAPKSDFIALKAEFPKLDINELVGVPTGLNNEQG